MAKIDQTDRGIEAIFDDDEIENSESPVVILVRNLHCVDKEDVRAAITNPAEEKEHYLILHPQPGLHTDMRLYYNQQTITEALVFGDDPTRDDVAEHIINQLTDLQERTDNAFVIHAQGGLFSEGKIGGFGIEKKGLFPLLSMNHDPKEKEKVFMSFAQIKNDGFMKKIKTCLAQAKRDEKNEYPWIFKSFERVTAEDRKAIIEGKTVVIHKDGTKTIEEREISEA